MNTRIQQHSSELFKFKHGLKRHPLYDVWGKMKARCFNAQDKDYVDYGARGISMDNNWALNFVQFYYWALENGYTKGMEIDRENNDGNYCPDNCRFVTRSQNMRNTRRNNMVTYKGQTKCLAEWSDILGIKRYTLFGRISKLGWTVEKAFETPVK